MTGIEGVGRPTATASGEPARRRQSGFFVPPETAGTGPGRRRRRASSDARSARCWPCRRLGGEAVADREARRHGHDMLAALAELQRALLGGGDDGAALQRLAELAAAVPHATDPRLAAMISAIVLRVRVELARRT